MKPAPKRAAVVAYHNRFPNALTKDIARAVGCSPETVRDAFHWMGVRPPGRREWKKTYDWDEIRRLYALGLSKKAISRRVGCSHRTVGIAINGSSVVKPTCPNCGVSMDPGATSCRECVGVLRVKINGRGELHCPGCHSYKPQEQFRPSTSKKWRGFASYCRSCETAQRRDHRHRNIEATREYDRNRRRRQSLAV